ncbi:Abi family protein [Staphylococcus rostri]|nr:Abi family protein [Staphylococcus rostri]
MKPFKTIDEQINILETRGLIFNDVEMAKIYLLRNNYYNVVNMYSKFFQSEENKYIEGTYFENIKTLHIYDTEIKSLLMKYILIAEKHFKSIFSYYFAEKYHNTRSFSYLNIANYNNNKNKPFEIMKTLALISRTISSSLNARVPNSIKHNYSAHNDVPIWVIVNELSFGSIIKLYKLSDDKTRNNIASELSKIFKSNINEHVKLEAKYIDKILENILEIRNCVAHDNKLLDFKCKNHPKYLKQLYEGTNLNPTDSRQHLFDVILSLKIFLPYDDYALFHNSFRKRTINMRKKLNENIVNKIYDSFGLPESWANNIYKMPQK